MLAGFGSAALLGGAFVFQALGYAPCAMCLWQRWPHAAAILLGITGALLPSVWIVTLGALAAATTGGIGAFHVGVEQGWWDGPSTCSSGSIKGLSTDDLMDQIMNAPLVQCDQIAWSFAGLSMAGWNSVLSFALMALWLSALRISAR